MKRNLPILVALTVTAACTTNVQHIWNEGINLIPTPVKLELGDGAFDLCNAAVKAEGEQAAATALFFADKVRTATGLDVMVDGREANVMMRIDTTLGLPAEGYVLKISEDGIEAVGEDSDGLFYAVQTLFQLLPAEIESGRKVRGMQWKVPVAEITDYPRFRWRGFHVDPCRHFLSVEDTKKQIDILAEYKINTMHWHLTDDQGWRIEIKKYPKLTEVGAWRTEFDGTVHGGFYSHEDIAEIVRYAAERHIDVVPEIEMPGHAIAVIRAYPELSCEKREIDNFYTWGTTDNVFCPGSEKTFEFLEDVMKEVVELFPCEYVHIGGDECLKNKWEECPACQARIKAEGLADDENSTAEEKLQTYAVGRMEQILAKYGKKMVGWDEILEGGLTPNAIVMSWQGEKGGIAAAQQGHEVIMTPSHEGMYLDSYQGDSKCEPVGFGRDITLEKIYGYNPVPEVLAADSLDNFVLGVQANVWSEYLYTTQQREYMMFPRAFALAEIAWTPLERKDFYDFARRADNATVRLDFHGINYHIPLPQQPGGSCDNIVFTDTARVEFYTTRPEKMVYTLNGRKPTLKSDVYQSPFVLTEDAVINIATVLPTGRMSRIRTVNVRKETPAPAADIAIESLDSGLVLKKTYGNFIEASEFSGATEWTDTTIRDLGEITTQEERRRDMQGIKFYGAVAEGYVNIPDDGIWRFSTDNDQLWIDGRLLIDNGREVKRYSRHDSEIALQAGLHSIKIVFVSNVIGGWTSARNNGSVSYKRSDWDRFHRIKPNQIFK